MEDKIQYDTIGGSFDFSNFNFYLYSVHLERVRYIDHISNFSLSLFLFRDLVFKSYFKSTYLGTLVKRQIRDIWCCGMTRRDARWLIYIVTLLQHACVTTSARSHSENNISVISFALRQRLDSSKLSKMSQRCTFLHDAVRKRGERSSAAPVESTTVSPSLWP